MEASGGMPRTFKLYEELEVAEHGKLSDQSVSYGLATAGDQTFTNWNGTIVGPPNTNMDNRIYFLNIVTDDTYPAQPPKISFTSKINIPSVNQSNGQVTNNFSGFKQWNANSSIEKCLIALKQEMIANKKAPQPADGDMY